VGRCGRLETTGSAQAPIVDQDQLGDTRDADLQRRRDDAGTDSGGRELVRQAGARRQFFPKIAAACVAPSGTLQRNRRVQAR